MMSEEEFRAMFEALPEDMQEYVVRVMDELLAAAENGKGAA